MKQYKEGDEVWVFNYSRAPKLVTIDIVDKSSLMVFGYYVKDEGRREYVTPSTVFDNVETVKDEVRNQITYLQRFLAWTN